MQFTDLSKDKGFLEFVSDNIGAKYLTDLDRGLLIDGFCVLVARYLLKKVPSAVIYMLGGRLSNHVFLGISNKFYDGYDYKGVDSISDLHWVKRKIKFQPKILDTLEVISKSELLTLGQNINMTSTKKILESGSVSQAVSNLTEKIQPVAPNDIRGTSLIGRVSPTISADTFKKLGFVSAGKAADSKSATNFAGSYKGIVITIYDYNGRKWNVGGFPHDSWDISKFFADNKIDLILV